MQAWPTVFIVRKGILVGRPRMPTELTATALREYQKGRIDKPRKEPARAAASQVGADGRPLVRNVRPGIDPFSTLNEPPVFQLIIREAGSSGVSSSRGSDTTMLRASIPAIVSRFWDVDRFAIRHDDADARRFDVVFRAPPKLVLPMARHIRNVMAASMGVRVKIEDREIDGFALVPGPTGEEAQAGSGPRAGCRHVERTRGVRFTSSSCSMATFVRYLEDVLGAPVLDRSGARGFYFFDVRLAKDRATLERQLLAACGLRLQAAKARRKVAVVERIGK